MKKIILILGFAFLVSFAPGQSAAKKLLFGGFWCGDVNDYVEVSSVYSIRFTNCDEAVVTDLVSAKAALDDVRSCTFSSSSGFGFGLSDTIVGAASLGFASENVFECSSTTGFNNWQILGFTKPVGEAAIVQFENGIITYVEYY